MGTEKTITAAEAVRNLIVCDTQFGWNGATTLKLPELLDLKARGWLMEGDENNEFSLRVEGQAVVARALRQSGPAEMAEQTGPDAAISSLTAREKSSWPGAGLARSGYRAVPAIHRSGKGTQLRLHRDYAQSRKE